jgi:hypothetical protein
MINNIIIGKNLLETITSALYEDPIVLFREYVQNSVDAYKKAIDENKDKIDDFNISIDIDKTTKVIVVKDNGYGIYTKEDFKDKMINIAMSDKSDRSRYIGFRGIGRLSAMPFCKTLKFINKAKGSDQLDICAWEGSKYRDLLNSDAKDYDSFKDIVSKIVDISRVKSEDNLNDHYFKVIIEEYGQELDDVINNENYNFKHRLRIMLPLKYSTKFGSSIKIINKYNEFMEEDFNDFAYSVKLDGEELQKNYTDSKHVLESDIIFWEIREKSGPNNRPGEKIGILWFTFNKKLTASENDTDYGILVRSKNVLMGNNDTFADLCANSREYISTHRELTQTLRGVYGELLINSVNLKDNARREWFKTDDNSYYLRGIITDFVKRLHAYRYKASKYFNNKSIEYKKNLKEALMDLVDVDTNKIDVTSFYEADAPKQNTDDNENSRENKYEYADEDIPRQSKTKKKTYEELMNVVKEFFEKEKKYDLFLKLRAYIKNAFQ